MNAVKYAICVALSFVALAAKSQPTQLFQNTCPYSSQNQTALQTGIQNIQNAITDGSTMHVSLSYPEDQGTSYVFAQITGIKVVNGTNGTYYASGVLPMRPPISNVPNASYSNGWFVGGVDTTGIYYYGEYKLGTDTWTTSTAAATAASYVGCYTITWWAQ